MHEVPMHEHKVPMHWRRPVLEHKVPMHEVPMH